MTDRVHYALPFGPLGQVVHALLIKKRLEAIFHYRYQLLEKTFNRSPLLEAT
jgi:ligand-binding SRPBCC domain-containing protein